jgi:hypothetical protein
MQPFALQPAGYDNMTPIGAQVKPRNEGLVT